MTLKLHGISNCDTVRKARRWLREKAIEHEFVDLRKDGVETQQLVNWCERHGWETLVNRRGTTWRQLPATERENLDEQRALKLMREHPTLIRRPILDYGDGVLVGFSEPEWEKTLGR